MTCHEDSKTVYDMVIVGGGIFGCWTAIAAASSDPSLKVALVEQFSQPAHPYGSSHGDGRIYRMAYNKREYLEMMSFSLEHWKKLEGHHQLQNPTEQLMIRNGVIAFDSVYKQRGTNWSVQALLEALSDMDVEHELLNVNDVRRRFPQIEPIEGSKALFVPEGGVLHASECVRACWEYARALNVSTTTGFKVEKIERHDDWVSLSARNKKNINAKKVIFAAGAWMSSVCSNLLNAKIKSTVTAERVCYYRAKDGTKHTDFSHTNLPCFLFQVDNGITSHGYYGVSDIGNGVKVGSYGSGKVVDDKDLEKVGSTDDRLGKLNDSDIIESCNRLIRNHFPGVCEQPWKTERCLFTCSKSHDFVIAEAPGWEGIVTIVGCGSGHGFKLAPAVGYHAYAIASCKKVPFNVDLFSFEKNCSL